MAPAWLSNTFLVCLFLLCGLPFLSYHSIYTIVYWGPAVSRLGKDGWRFAASLGIKTKTDGG